MITLVIDLDFELAISHIKNAKTHIKLFATTGLFEQIYTHLHIYYV